jgi:hypothetical protein
VRDEGSVTQTPLVLGAGPAGCGAAIALARDGTPPCIIERTRETGDALCGGFLSWQTLAQLDRLGVTGLGAHPISRVRVCYRNKIATARLPNLAGGVSRHRLDSVMQSVAVKAGAMLERGVTARSYAGGVLHTDGGDRTAEALFLASGKHDVRGFGRPKPLGDAPMGLRFRIATHPTLRALIDDSIELHLFDGGYAGLLLQEDGSANLCMALRKSRFAEAGGDAATLLRQLGEEHPRLGERLAFASSMPGADAIAAQLAPLDPLSVRVEAGKQFVRRLAVVFQCGQRLRVDSDRCQRSGMGSSTRCDGQFCGFCGDIMNKTVTRFFTKAELATQALEMLAIGNVAVQRAQARNRALGIANHYSVAGRIEIGRAHV